MKSERVNLLNELLNQIKETMRMYHGGSPAWTLLHTAGGNIKSIHYLETEANFSDETLGGKNE